MQDTDFYRQILGLEEPWTVNDIALDMPGGKVEIEVVYGKPGGVCPECGNPGTLHDHAPERRWRHLDTCQLQTIIRCQVPRVKCPEHGVKTMSIPWAAPHGRFTRMFEHLCIQWLLATRNQSETARLLGLSRDQVHHLMSRAVERGLARREERPIRRLGIDEKSMKKGHHYLTVLCDLDRQEVYEVAEERTEEAARELLAKLPGAHRDAVESICMDMWQAFINAARKMLPGAAVVHDRFHVSVHLNDAVDKTRRQENRKLRAAGEEGLKRSRYLFLKNFANLTFDQAARFAEAYKVARQTAAVWECKELFRAFWEQKTVVAAREFLEDWLKEARRRRLPALTIVAKMIADHAVGLLNYIEHPVTNALAENLNGKIQQLKATARGFRSFAHYRINILFHFAGLDLNPLKIQ
jgi:transposase